MSTDTVTTIARRLWDSLVKLAPTAGVFVPGECDGISHNPREKSTIDACEPGIKVLATVVRRLAG